MTRAARKDEERAWLESFVANVEHDPKIEKIHDHEGPDFLVDVEGGSQIGIEVTEVADEALAKTTGIMPSFHDELTDALVTEGIQKLHVHVSANEYTGAALDRRTRRAAIEGIVRLAKANLPRVIAGEDDVKIEDEALDAAGVAGVVCVSFWTGDETQAFGGYHAMGQREGDVQLCINKKAENLTYYRKAAPRVWLLLIIGAGMRSAVWDEILKDASYTSPFDRTYWYDVSRRRGGRL